MVLNWLKKTNETQDKKMEIQETNLRTFGYGNFRADKLLGSCDLMSRKDFERIVKRTDISKNEWETLKKNFKIEKKPSKKKARANKKGFEQDKREEVKNKFVDTKEGRLFFSDYASVLFTEEQLRFLGDKEVNAKERLARLLEIAREQNALLGKWDIVGLLDITDRTFQKIKNQVDKYTIEFHNSSKACFPNGRYFSAGLGEDYKRLDRGNTKLMYEREFNFLREMRL